MTRLAGVVLTGGASRRMGRDKATLTLPGRFGGRTLVEQVVGVLGRRCAPIFVMAGVDQVLPELPARILRDPTPGLGPLPAVGAGLRAAARAGAARAFVCAVDMPLLTVDLIDALAAARTGPEAGPEADVVLAYDGRDHYLAGVYRAALGERIGELVAAGARRMSALTDLVDVRRVEPPDARVLFNLNSPDDLPVITR